MLLKTSAQLGLVGLLPAVGCMAPVEEPWADGTFWSDGSGWLDRSDWSS
jgi:hypothetical protein